MTNDTQSYNHLKDEKSSYLLQHKDNPVHWWSYSPEAIQKAKDENKPIFMSVGYSSCHWCHVMAHESFEDQATADYLNENFINIKVDKEELPDIDTYYQAACHLFTQSGGWPLSAFLLPDMRPFFVGTYFPKVASGGQTSFMELLKELKRAYSEEQDKIEENAKNVTETIAAGLVPKDKVEFEGHFPHPTSILEAIDKFKDNENGGYGQAPKFPQFAFYEWAIEQILEGMIPKEQGEHIVNSMEAMLLGGVFDHARGGIHRYSVDEKWLVPHFEKMLYDQAGLIRVLSKLSLIYPSPIVFDGLMNTLEYLEKELLSDKKIFFSAQDADSEGVEGLYFTFSMEEFEDAINSIDKESGSDEYAKEMDKFKRWFQVSKEGNFERALNIVSMSPKFKEEYYTQEGWTQIRKIREALLSARSMRIPPGTDTKGVASWNFSLCSALVDVMQYCKIDPIKRKASGLFNSLVEGIYENFLASKDESGTKIRHTTTRGNSLLYFEDYVFFAETQLRIYEVTGNPVFKDNFFDTVNFIGKEFIDEGKFLTRAKMHNDHELYPNQEVSSFDQSYRSSSATLLGLLRRAELLDMDKDRMGQLESAMENLTHDSLKNPLGAGEALRTLTYPKEAYRKVKVPGAWLEDQKFIEFLPYFLPRFVLDYHRDDEESWEICSMTSCELSDKGLDKFIASLTPGEE